MRILDLTNEPLAHTGHRFVEYPTDGQDFLILFLNEEQIQRLRSERGWRFPGDDPEWERQQREEMEELRRDVQEILSRLQPVQLKEENQSKEPQDRRRSRETG